MRAFDVGDNWSLKMEENGEEVEEERMGEGC